MRARLQLASLSIALAIVVLHSIVSYDPFPGWSDDPTRLPAAMTALGPRGSVALDALLMIAASVLMGTSVFEPSALAKGWTVQCSLVVLASTGAAAALLRVRDAGVDDLVLGLNWSAGMYASVAIALAARDATCRRVCAAVLLGIIGLLAVRAGVQYLVENPQAYADFKRSKPDILAAHGWSADSPLAKSFERRVSQPDAGAWFGLSNVLGSIAAGCSVAFLALAIRTWRALRLAGESTRDTGLLLLAVALVASLTTITFSMSKGAIVATCAGVTLIAISHVRMRSAFRSVLGLACIAAPIALVVARGMVGERLHELSLLFRWFYFQGATKVILGPGGWNGVAPGGFQDAYMLAKPALSTENVTSPHNVILDCLAAFGVFGIAWVAVLTWYALRAGQRLSSDAQTPHPPADHAPLPLRGEIRLVVAIAAVPTLLAALVERELATEWSTAVRLVGLVAFALASSGVLLALRRDIKGANGAIAAGALTVLLHAQIDMVATTPGSSPWFWAMLALAGAAAMMPATGQGQPVDPSTPLARQGVGHTLGVAASLLAVLGSLAWCTAPVRRLWEWEGQLRAAALMVRPIPIANSLMSSDDPATRQDRWREAADVLSDAIGRRVPVEVEAIASAMREARVVLVERAIPRLERACALEPAHPGTYRAASELLLTHGLVRQALGDSAHGEPLARRARELMGEFVARHPYKATAWAWLGLVDRTVWEQWKGSKFAEGALDEAIDAYEHASKQDPHGVVNIPPLVELLLARGRPDVARRWAKQALERQNLTRLDPLAGLSEEQLKRLRESAEGP